MKEIRIAIAGVGNCSSSLVQGISYYRNKQNTEGLVRQNIAGYLIDDIKFVCAFDIDSRKIGQDLSKAIFAKPNNSAKFSDVENLDAPVYRAPTFDGFPNHFAAYSEDIRFVESDSPAIDVVKKLKEHKVDVLVNYMPVGSEKAAEYYANCCLKAGVCFINAMPVFICSTNEWASRFRESKLVCAGDDIKSQVGATITHRVLVHLFEKRGVKLRKTYQLNVGGNTDFLNMLNQDRLKLKKISKTNSIQTLLKNPLSNQDMHIGPSDFVPWLKDQKTAFIRLEGTGFGGLPINIDFKIDCQDSPNSAGVIIDVIRFVKAAKDKSIFGVLEEVSAYAFKSPINPLPDDEVFRRLDAWENQLI